MRSRLRHVLETLPHALTAARLLLVGLAYTIVPDGPRPVFIAIVLVAVLTDMLDGPVARKLGVESEAGANFDSIADFAFYASLVVWTYRFEPAVIGPLLPLLAALFALYVLALALAKMRFGVLGFHNRWTRLSATFGVVFSLYVVGWGWNVILGALLLGTVLADLWQRGRAIAGRPPKRREAPA